MYRLITATLWVCMAPWNLAAEAAEVSMTVTDLKTGAPVEGATVILQNSRSAPPIDTEIIQKYRQFQPASLVVPVGSSVAFPNKDVTQHHVYSFSPAKRFDIELYAGEPEAPVVFDTTGVVELGCNIHDQMQAFVIVTNSSVTNQTDGNGMASLTLPQYVPDSEPLVIVVWHPRLKDTTEPVSFQIAQPTSTPLTLSVDLTPQKSESGRLDRLQKRFQDL